MWSNYTKTFVFRDCFDKTMTKGNVEAVNKLLTDIQKNKNFGALITSSVLSADVANTLEATENEDDGTWDLNFYKDDTPVASISMFYLKEVQLCFEIEEEIETGEFIIHYCTTKGFKEYQN